MKKYEVMYIVRPSIDEEERKALMEEVNLAFTENGSSVLEVVEKGWGLRDLAYEIDGETKGYYVLQNVEATPEAIQEFERVCNIKENIIRHIVIAL